MWDPREGKLWEEKRRTDRRAWVEGTGHFLTVKTVSPVTQENFQCWVSHGLHFAQPQEQEEEDCFSRTDPVSNEPLPGATPRKAPPVSAREASWRSRRVTDVRACRLASPWLSPVGSSQPMGRTVHGPSHARPPTANTGRPQRWRRDPSSCQPPTPLGNGNLAESGLLQDELVEDQELHLPGRARFLAAWRCPSWRLYGLSLIPDGAARTARPLHLGADAPRPRDVARPVPSTCLSCSPRMLLRLLSECCEHVCTCSELVARMSPVREGAEGHGRAAQLWSAPRGPAAVPVATSLSIRVALFWCRCLRWPVIAAPPPAGCGLCRDRQGLPDITGPGPAHSIARQSVRQSSRRRRGDHGQTDRRPWLLPEGLCSRPSPQLALQGALGRD